MRRALVLALVLVAAAAAVFAQERPAGRLAAVLSPGSSTTSAAVAYRASFEQGLRDAGWRPQQDVRVEFRYAEGKQERLVAIARDFVASRPDVIVARSTSAIRVVKDATSTVPIVMAASGADPVQLGFVSSLGRPGGNITGLTLLNEQLPLKQLELLKEMVPRATRVASLQARDRW